MVNLGTPQVSTEDLRDILDNLSEMVCRFRPDGTILYVNEAYCRIAGQSAEEMLGRSFAPILHPDDRERVDAELAMLSPEEPTRVIENRFVLSSGEVRWTQWHNRALFDEQGRIIELQSSGRDITEQVMAEQELTRRQESSRFLADAAEALNGSLEYENTLTRVTRMVVPFLADLCTVSLLDTQGGFYRLALTHVDPRLEAILRAHKEASAGLPGGCVPRPCLLEQRNPLSERILAGQPVLVPRFTEEDLDALQLDPDDLDIVRLAKTQSYMVVPLSARGRILGALFFASSSGYSCRTYDERDLELAMEIARRAGIAIDNARLYKELEIADRRKDEFLATLAHELRNPMAAISNAMQILELPDINAEMRARALVIARRQLRQQARLVDDLLDVSRLTRGKISLRNEPVDIAVVMAEAAEVYRPLLALKRQSLVVETMEQPLCVDGDPIRLQQIVSNLLDNAAKYSPEGGHIWMRASREPGDQVVISVRDEGTGIAADMLPHVFELFVQEAPAPGMQRSGLGIGLTIVKQLVELHGGQVEATSPGPGKGSEITVHLPELDETAVQPGRSVIEGRGPRVRILVVDDNVDAADTLAILLESWGHAVCTVYSGQAALEAAPSFAPDLVLVDIGMPGIDGYTTCRRLREVLPRPNIELVAVTGYAQPQDISRAHAAGFDRHVPKPVDTAVLRTIVSQTAARIV